MEEIQKNKEVDMPNEESNEKFRKKKGFRI